MKYKIQAEIDTERGSIEITSDASGRNYEIDSGSAAGNHVDYLDHIAGALRILESELTALRSGELF